MTKRHLIILFLLGLGLSLRLWAGDCFELVNYYSSRPTNYTTRGGNGWMATGAAVEPTSSMYFYSQYYYVMLTGGNKNTAPGQLQLSFNPTNGIGTLTFCIAKPCISDNYSGAGVYVYVDGQLVWSQVVVAYSLSYQTITVPINMEGHTVEIRVTNYYTNTTTSHNNRIAFAHFCWTDYTNPDPGPGPGPDDPPTPPTPPTPQKRDTVYYSAYVCQEDLPFVWNGIECVRTGNYPYVTTSSEGKDSTTILMLTVSPAPSTKTETYDLLVGDKLMWGKRTYIPTAAGDTTFIDTLRNSAGCLQEIIYIKIHTEEHITPPSIGQVTYYVCPGQTFTIHGEEYTAPSQYNGIFTTEWLDTLSGQGLGGADSLCKVIVIVSAPTVTQRVDTSICQGESFEWYGQTVNEAKTYAHYVPSQINPDCDSLRLLLHVGYRTAPTRTENHRVCSTGLPFRWHGQDYTSSGTYSYSAPAANQCDSVITLNLTVVEPQTGDTTARCCKGDLPFNWYEHNLTQSGTATHLFQSADGCDSVVTLHLTVQPEAQSFHEDKSVCEGGYVYWRNVRYSVPGTYYDTVWQLIPPFCDSAYYSMTLTLQSTTEHRDTVVCCSSSLPYIWNKHLLTQSGEYIENLTNVAGCDSIASLLLIVRNTDSVVINERICEAQIPYLWNGQSITAAGVYKHSTTNQFGCDSVTIMHLSVNAYASTDTTAWLCPNDVPFTWHGQSLSATGALQWTGTNRYGCDSVVTLHAHVAETPVTQTTDTAICPGSFLRWRGRIYREAGTYIDTVRTATPAQCDSIYHTLNLTLLQPTDSVTNVTICKGETFVWHGRSYNRTLTQTEVLTNAAGCDSVCTLKLTVQPNTYGSERSLICSGDSVKIRDRWYSQAGTYTDTLRGANQYGCDSICRITIEMPKKAVVSQEGVSLYPNELPYLWRGQEYTVEGLYSDTVVSPLTGCDSIYYRLQLHVLDDCELKPRVQH